MGNYNSSGENNGRPLGLLENQDRHSGCMIIYVDIDETICFYSGKRRYELAEPNYDNINKINKQKGKTIF